MTETWAKPADRVDYGGEPEGEKLGVALFDPASRFHHPAALARARLRSAGGHGVRLRYRLVVHPAMDSIGIQRLYQGFTAGR